MDLVQQLSSLTPGTSSANASNRVQPGGEFVVGSTLVYALLGRCLLQGVESRDLGGAIQRFYKLEILKSNLSRSAKKEPAIWVPVASARARGLRAPMSAEQASTALAAIESREYYFPVRGTWNDQHKLLEDKVREEGGLGLAKAESFLHVLVKKLIVAPPEVGRFQDTIHKLLMRELCEALKQSVRDVESRITKGLKHKLLPDQ